MIKKATGIVILTLALLFSLAGYAFASGFADLESHWAAGQINQWVEQGLVAGYEDGTFKPDRQVTRAEFVVLINRAFKVDKEASDLQFTDVRPGSWYYEDVAAAAAAGYITGYPDGSFGAERSITRQEAAAVLVKLLKLAPAEGGASDFKDADHIAAWAAGYVGAVVRDGLMMGMPDQTFQPQKSISRAEAVVSLSRALEAKAAPQESGIAGKVLYNNEAVPNAVIKVYQAGDYRVLQLAKTNAKGNFELNLSPGAYDVTAGTENEVAYRSGVQVTAGKVTEVNLTLQAAATLSGELLDQEGKPLKNTTLVFTTNPTFTAGTDNNGAYSVALVPHRDYQVRFVSDGGDNEPVELDSISVGAAGRQSMSFTASDDAKEQAGGGGGGAGTNKPPVVESVTFIVDGREITETGSNNSFSIDLSDYTDDSVFTGLTVKASSDAKTASVSVLGISKTITFNNGVASASVGKSGISLKELKSYLKLLGTNKITITVTGDTGLTSKVKVTVNT
ncbi:MAG: S-layer homology domain-containing protein [Pelotomaculum sp.]|jgi:hypothetical protein